MTNENDILLVRMNDLASKAIKTGCAASKFLSPAEAQSAAERFSRRRDVMLAFDGGYEGAERTRAIFTNPDWGNYERTELFAALKIVHRPQDVLGHRDILGALMGLGIERGTIGDILVNEPFAAFVCLPELGGYIAEHFTKAGRMGIEASVISLDELPVHEEELTIKTDTVASLRLDAVLCAAFGLSRTKVVEYIIAGRVSLNHQLCLKPDKEVSEQSLLSVRGLGRVKLMEVGGVSRKGRSFVKIGLYGR
ncbi:MAG: YlmH/Sll1252 family protein [Oscillospiraceae bacterium]|nr:YlmH/Sll1252 family protein [Oscillospiraceae bacterium]